MSDAASALFRAIRSRFATAGLFVPEEIRSRPWASATFIGTRHRIAFKAAGEGIHRLADGFARHLADAEFDLRGHFVAEITLLSDRRTFGPEEECVHIVLEALTMEDA